MHPSSWGIMLIIIYSNDHGLTLTYFAARLNIFTLLVYIEKSVRKCFSGENNLQNKTKLTRVLRLYKLLTPGGLSVPDLYSHMAGIYKHL